jgi:hypothetical protein
VTLYYTYPEEVLQIIDGFHDVGVPTQSRSNFFLTLEGFLPGFQILKETDARSPLSELMS